MRSGLHSTISAASTRLCALPRPWKQGSPITFGRWGNCWKRHKFGFLWASVGGKIPAFNRCKQFSQRTINFPADFPRQCDSKDRTITVQKEAEVDLIRRRIAPTEKLEGKGFVPVRPVQNLPWPRNRPSPCFGGSDRAGSTCIKF